MAGLAGFRRGRNSAVGAVRNLALTNNLYLLETHSSGSDGTGQTMGFRLASLMAVAVAAAASAHVAWAQGAALTGLRGSTDNGQSPLVLADAAADPAAIATATPAPADATDSGRVQRQLPQAKGAEPDPLDPTATGTISHKVPETEDDPFAALGIRAGSFILYPSLTTSFEHATNASGDGRSDTLTVTPELRLQSDWALNAATLTLRGSYAKDFAGGTPDSPSGSVDGTGRIDLKPGWDIGLAGNYTYSHQSISDPNFPAGVDNRPGVHDFTGSAALDGRFGRTIFTAEGKAGRTLYENGTSAGAIVDQSDRNNTVFGGRLRLGYESPLGVTPFVEGEVSRRQYDQTVDNNGLKRSSLAVIGRAGLAVDRGPVLTGEMALGYGVDTLDDPTLAPLRALTVDGSLVWSPTRLYTVTFAGSTAFNPSTDAGSSGSVAYDGSVDVAYAWKRNVTVDWTTDVTHETFQGSGRVDTTVKAGVGATWKLNRRTTLSGGYSHEWAMSTAAGNSYQSDALTVALRLQK